MKYKCIKKYPRSPIVGGHVTTEKAWDCYMFDPKDWPEFWELIPVQSDEDKLATLIFKEIMGYNPGEGFRTEYNGRVPRVHDFKSTAKTLIDKGLIRTEKL